MVQFGVDGERAYGLLKRMGPARLGGSERERQAAQVLADEVRSLGLAATEEAFPVPTFSDDSAGLEVLSPFRAALAAKACGRSGQTPTEGFEARLVYAETGGPAYLTDARGAIALVYGRLNAVKYRALVEAGALGFVCIGNPGHSATLNMIEVPWYQRWGKIPGAFISFDDGVRLVRDGVERVRLTVRQREFEADSRNVIAEVRGTRHPDEIILVGAHYDSHREMDGAHDNGGGTVVAMELLRHFSKHPPFRTLRFVWFGSEELGCGGSGDYVQKHAGDLDRIPLLLNFDVAGGLIGQDSVDVSGPSEIKAHFDLLSKERGLGLNVQEKLYGGDNWALNEVGIPAVTLHRSGGTASYLHSPDDRLDLVDGLHLGSLAELGTEFLSLIANAHTYPFKREIPESVQKQLRMMNEDYRGMAPEPTPTRK